MLEFEVTKIQGEIYMSGSCSKEALNLFGKVLKMTERCISRS